MKKLTGILILLILVSLTACSNSNNSSNYSIDVPEEAISIEDYLNRPGKRVWFVVRSENDRLYTDSEISDIILEEEGTTSCYSLSSESNEKITFEDISECKTIKELYDSVESLKLPSGIELEQEDSGGHFEVSEAVGVDEGIAIYNIDGEGYSKVIFDESNPNTIIFNSDDNYTGLELSGFLGNVSPTEDTLLVTPTTENFTNFDLTV